MPGLGIQLGHADFHEIPISLAALKHWEEEGSFLLVVLLQLADDILKHVECFFPELVVLALAKLKKDVN